MASTPSKILEYLETIETTYAGAQVIDEVTLRALVWFFLYGENVLSQIGRTWRGCSFRQSETTCLLTVRSSYNGIPDVVFITGRNPTDCVLLFAKKWHADTLAWYPDKYA
jgi:hypothetical protein